MPTQSHPQLRVATFLTLAAVLLPLACESTGEGADNRGAKRGAATGALVGLTLGALTGDAGLAMKGAVAGGVTGGAAGSMQDLDSQRQTERTEIMADAIVGRGGGEPVPAASRPQTWDRLNVFPGKWSCSMWGLDEQGERVTATASWTGTLASTSTARLTLDEVDLAGFGDDVDDDFGGGYSELSFDPEGGYEMLNVFTSTPDARRWVGERMSGEERYSFYYVGTEDTGHLGTARSQMRLELRFVGRDLFMLDTYSPEGSAEKQVQSYRFTRQN